MPDVSRPKLLIVDDEIAQMKALCDTLRDHGFETAGFSSALQALEALKEKRFDLLLSDLMMPEMDGITLLQEALKHDPNLVAIIMTGEGTITTAVEAMKSGALDYILKPFKLSVILPVLSRALAVRRLRVENAQLTKRVQERTTELEAANKELEAFSYSVSHDLRAPLRHIHGFSNMLIEDYASGMPPDAQRMLNVVSSSSEKMGCLIDDLLRCARLSRQPLSKQLVNVTALVHEVCEELSAERANRNVEVRIGVLPDCIGDLTLLKQVFVNLLSNAFKYTRKKEKAVIEVDTLKRESETKEGEKIYLVRDNGAGFNMENVNRLFGVFQRLHSDEQFEGTGVGLSIVHRIIQRHGGHIWAEAEVDKGATFFFSLPE